MDVTLSDDSTNFDNDDYDDSPPNIKRYKGSTQNFSHQDLLPTNEELERFATIVLPEEKEVNAAQNDLLLLPEEPSPRDVNIPLVMDEYSVRPIFDDPNYIAEENENFTTPSETNIEIPEATLVSPVETQRADSNDDVYGDLISPSGLKLTSLGTRSVLADSMHVIMYLLTSTTPSGALLEKMASLEKLLDMAIRNIKTKNFFGSDDRMQACLSSDTVSHMSTFCLPAASFKSSLILTLIQNGSQSANLLLLSDNIRLDFKYIAVVTNTEGGGTSGRKYEELSTKLFLKNKRSIIEIKNPDDCMCMARALVVGMSKIKCEKINNPVDMEKNAKIYRQLRRQFCGKKYKKAFQYIEAFKLCEKVGVSTEKVCGIAEAQRFEEQLNINIVIIARDLFNEVVYNGAAKDIKGDNNTIFLYRSLDETGLHYDLIGNICKFYTKPFYCVYCENAYKAKGQHKCKDIANWCYSCYERNCLSEKIWIDDPQRCQICKVFFRNEKCREKHFTEMKCEQFYFCLICQNRVTRISNSPGVLETNQQLRSRHKCQIKCKVCNLFRDPLHKCYLQKGNYKEVSKRYLFLDFESTQENNKHVPVFCHIKWFEEVEPAIWVWKSKSFGLSSDVTNEVGDFIFCNHFRGYTIIAHNMRGYDGCFLLNYVVSRGVKPDIILKGRQIISLRIPKLCIRLIDSLNFLPMALAGFQKAFGLEESEKKGYFPHLFIKLCNFEYIGEFPEEHFYVPGSMSSEKYQIFKKWYDENTHPDADVIFNFEKELREYCIQDVNLLQKGVWSFRELILNLTANKCDAFQYLTLPSLASAVYKVDHMLENSIAALPAQGYVDTQHYSSCSIEWLNYLEKKEGKKIVHIANSPTGEAQLCHNIRVDGFDEQSQTVYEFYGCFYHACQQCFKNRQKIHPFFGITFQAVYERTIEKEIRLKLLKYKLVSIWECKWNDMKGQNVDVENFVKENQEKVKPLNPHDSFYGGRVEVFKMLIDDHKTKCNYEDVNSLYPSVNLKCPYPIGHPKMVFNDFGSFETVTDRIFGFIRCKILPPPKLYIPVLPGKYGGETKLLFALCHTCASLKPRQTELCEHTSDERALIGTWFSEEIKLAQKYGYVILEIFSAYSFEQTSTDLFASYIKKFYKIKLQSSGLPANCITPEAIEKFKKMILDHEGVDLTNCNFTNNSGLRSVAKLMLNSLWGKFGTRRLQMKHTFCSTIEAVSEIFLDSSYQVCNVIDMSTNIVLVVYEKKNLDFLQMNNVNNIYIASCTTAWARIKLYNFLAQVSERCAYCDTDSIIYISMEGNNLPTGEFLGELKSELPEGLFIIRHCAAAPKMYGYVIGSISDLAEYNVVGSCVKAKGFRINSTTEEAFNFENMKALIENFSNKEIENCSIFVPIETAKKMLKRMDEKSDVAIEEHLQKPRQCSAYVDADCISVFNPHAFHKTATWEIVNREEQKIFLCNYDKRMVNRKTLDTLPFGYCK